MRHGSPGQATHSHQRHHVANSIKTPTTSPPGIPRPDLLRNNNNPGSNLPQSDLNQNTTLHDMTRRDPTMRVHDPPTSDLYQDALPRPRNTGRDDPPQRRRSAFDSTRPPTQRYARAPDDEDAFGSITPAPPTPPQRAVRNQNRRTPYGYEGLDIPPLGPSPRRETDGAWLARLLHRAKLRDFDYDADPEDDELAPPRALWYESDDELGMSNVRPSRRNFGEVGLGYDRRFPHQPEPWMSGRLPRFRLPPYGGRQDRINNLAMPSRARPRPEMDSGGLGFEDDEDPLDGRPYRRGAGMGRAAGSRAGPWRRYHG